MRWVAVLAICFVSASASADWGARRDPFDVGTVNRYKAILARDPYDDGALRQLAAMYRKHRTIAKLEAEYRAQLAAGETWAVLVVLARLPAEDAAALWRRAVVVKPDDARAWIAIGDAAKSDAAAARDAYQRAAKAALVPRDKRVALTKLVATARNADVIDGAYVELIALAPKDGKLWLDRGNAQIAAKRFAAAKESFATAESLLRTDPERRLTAMSSQGIALEGMGQSDDAIAQYERTLAALPRGYFLGEELVVRIVDIERKRKRLASVTARFETRWPERKRGHFEWVLLGDLYGEQHREDRAVEAYKRAVAVAPTEVATQRKLIALLDKQHRPEEALAQHEAAARVAPGDARIQLELAKRYHADQPAKAKTTLAALGRRLAGNVSVRQAIAAMYEEWNELALAIGEYEAIAKLEPDEVDHPLVLGDAYWRAEQKDKARAAWKRLERIGTRDALYRYAEVLAQNDFWAEAVVAYSGSLSHDAANGDALYGRARAYEELGRFSDAIADAQRAVALSSTAKHDDGMRTRNLVVRILGNAYTSSKHVAIVDAVARWRFAFERGDVAAGYLLAAHHERVGSPQHHEVLLALYRLAPDDDTLGLRVARSYVRHGDHARARAELERIGRRTPSRAKDIAEQIALVDADRARIEREIRLREEEARSSAYPDLVGRRRRTGMRFAVGSDVDGTSAALLGIGLYRQHRIAPRTAFSWRFDWLKRDDEMVEHKAVGLGLGLSTRIWDARRFELAAAVGTGFELRYGSGIPTNDHDRGAFTGDVSLEMLPRALPMTLGLRLVHSLNDPARSSTLFVELGVEVR